MKTSLIELHNISNNRSVFNDLWIPQQFQFNLNEI